MADRLRVYLDSFTAPRRSHLERSLPPLRHQKVTVTPAMSSDTQDRTFRFRIDAMLLAEPAPEPVVFDSELQPGTGDFEVKGGVE